MNDNKPYTHKDEREIVVDEATQQFIIHGPEGSTAVLSYGDMEALRGYFEAQGSSKSRCSSTCSHGGSCSLEANHGGKHETRDSLRRDTYCHWGAPEQGSPAITADSVRALTETVAKEVAKVVWRSAFEAALQQVDEANAKDEVPLGVYVRLEALRDATPNG